MSRYDVEKFVPQPDQELICCICTNVLDEPMESPCRHVFCKICIETWLNNRRTCPTCRFTVTNGDLKPVLPLVRNMLNKLTLICDFSDNGCKDLVLLEKYQNHIKACDYEKVVCRYPKCAKSMLRKLIKSHEDEKCKYREILCEKDCGLKITVGSVETHDCLKALKAFCENKDKETETLKGELIELKNAFEKIREEVNNFKKEYIRQRNNSWESSSTSNQDSDYSVIDWNRSRSPSRSRSRSPLPLYHVLSSARRRSHSRTRSRSRSRSRSHTSTRSRSSTRYNTSYSTSPRRSPYSSGSSIDSFPLRQRDRDEQEAILNSINLVSESFPLLDRNLNRAHDLLLTINNPVPIVRCIQCEELQENCQCEHHSEYSEGPSLTSYTEEGQFSSDNGNPDEDHQSSEHNTTVDGSPESQRHRSFSEEHSHDSYSPTPVEGQNVSFSYNPTPLNQSPTSTTGPAQRSPSLSSQSEDKMAQIPLVVDMDTWSGRVATVNTSPISRMEPSYSPRSRASSSSSLSSERSRSRSPVIGSSYRDCSSESVNNSPGDRPQRHSSHSPEPGYSPSGYRTCSSSSSCSSSKSYSYSPTCKRKRSKSPDASPSLKSSSPNSSASGPCYRASERIDSDTDHKHNLFDSSRAQKKQRVCKDLNYSPSEWSPKSDIITEYNPTSISELSKSRYRFKINEGASTSSQHSDYATNQHQHLNNTKYSSNDETDNERKTAKKSKRKGGGKKRKRSKRKLHHSGHNDFSGNEQATEDLSASKPKLKSIVGLVTPNSKIKFIVRKSNGELMSSESSEDTN